MSDYAAEIRVNTKITTQKAKEQLLSLENRMLKASDKVDTLNQKMKELEGRKTPGAEYQNLEKQLAEANKELQQMIEWQNDLEKTGIKYGSSWDIVNDKVSKAAIHVDDIKEKMNQLEQSGKAFTTGSDTQEYTKLSQQLAYAKKDLELLEQKHTQAMNKMKSETGEFGKKAGNTFKNIKNTAQKAFVGVASAAKTAITKTSELFRKMRDTAKRVFHKIHDDTKKQNSLFSTMKTRLKGIALSLVFFNWITKAFNTMVSSVKEGIQNLSRYSEEYNSVMSGLASSLATLKNAFVTAFAPILTVAIPYMTQLIHVLTVAINRVAQFIAALTGKSTWVKAKQQTIDYADSLGDIAKEAKKAYTSLASFDELNVLNKNESTGGSGAGTVNPDDLFEEVPIDSNIDKLAKKFKDILSKLFEPLKKAWDRQGKKVMEAWKYALNEVSKLVKSIGKDFLEVWNQEETVKIFEDILLIIADIGLIVGNLAKRFREAWEANDTGKKILENIRDVIGAIIENIREAADFTVDWSDKLDFSPLLTAFERFTASFVRVADFLSGVLSDLYTQVLLPLGKWVLEKGLPDLLDILTRFNNEVDWEGIRERLSTFWEHLEKFGETIGEGLIIFIGDLSVKLKDFVNSDAFDKFLTKIEEWMDHVEPEDVAKGLERICEAILLFKGISAVVSVLTAVKSFISFFSGGSAAASVTGMGNIATAIKGLCTAAAGLFVFEAIKNPFIDFIASMDGTDQDPEKKVEIMKERYEGLGGVVQQTKDFVSVLGQKIAGVFTDMPTYIEGYTPSWNILEEALEKVGDGTVYTDEQFQKMMDTMGLTTDDVETLRQATLDANEDLRSLADSSEELWGATPQTLKNINEGLLMIESGLVENMDALHEYGDAIGFTDEAFLYLGERLENIGEKVNKTKDSFSEAGKNTAEGFNKGFLEASSGTEGIVKGFAGAVIDVVENVLEIHSPSKAFERIGKFLIEGLIQGIKSMGGNLQTALMSIYNTVKGILDKMKSTVSGMVSSVKEKASSVKSRSAAVWNQMPASYSLLRTSYQTPETVEHTVSDLEFGNTARTAKTVMKAAGYQLPDLETGGVTTGSTIAGFKRGSSNSAFPMENSTGWMDKLADKINGGGEFTFVAQMDGDVVFKETVHRNEVYKKMNGGQSAYT